MKYSLDIKISDLFRATLADDSGNVGYVGIAPDGSAYHVVVPVDRQIARGLKAWIQSDDGTPFGGYSHWHYLCCLTYPSQVDVIADRTARLERTYENGGLIQNWGKGFGIEVRLAEDMR